MTPPNLDPVLSMLRRIDRTSRLRDLARTLGFQPDDQRITRDAWRPFGLDPVTLRATLHSVGSHPAGRLLALVFTHTLDLPAAEHAARAIQSSDFGRSTLLIASDRAFRRLAVLATGPDDVTRTLVIDRNQPRAADAETILDMVASPDDGTASLAIRYARALDRARVTTRFFDDFRDRRAAIAAAWSGIPATARSDREQLALLLLCRLMFLYFLQLAGHLAGNPRFLPDLVRRRKSRSIFRTIIKPLFFGVFNRRPERRTAAARRLGDLPYLNGGLFERHALERRHPDLDLPDSTVHEIFDALLERYRFTTREPADSMIDASFDGGIDPEMLGRVFEGVMAADHRAATGAFYTPAHAVDPLVRDTLAAWLEPRVGTTAADVVLCRESAAPYMTTAASALSHARVLDPACGSGAFLLGALSRIAAIRTAATGRDTATIRRDIIGSTLHGVDLDGDAALLCALRLWLALADSDGPVRPLPNLDRRIRQGDALLDPIDLARAASSSSAAADPAVRHATRALQPVAARYLDAEPHQKDRLRTAVQNCERAIARAWIDALRRHNRHHIRELAATAAGRDLFGDTTDIARAAAAARPAALELRHELDRLRRRIRDDRATPFFSFHVHFADTTTRGFDIILSNPPWVRAHRWPHTIRAAIRRRYAHTLAGWTAGARLAGAPAAAAAQTDIALLFLDRAISLLAPGGTLGLLLPAKVLRSLYAGSARARLLSDTPILAIRDCSLDQHAIFRADAFATSIIARRVEPAAPPPPHVRVTLIRRDDQALAFDIDRSDLPLFPDDPAAPWLLAPEHARLALRHMQKAGPAIGLHPGLRVRRGIFTGANSIFIISDARPRLGDLASIRTIGFDSADDAGASAFEAIVEATPLRPLVRGADIRPWHWKSQRLVIYLHDHAGRPTRPPLRIARFLERHHAALDRRSGARNGFLRSAIFRASADTIAPKVAWHDLAPTLHAVALPADTRSPLGIDGPLIPLNTTYFIPTADHDRALILAAFLNSTPVRLFARTIAERAKDTRFRFFAWTIAALPLPLDALDRSTELLRLSRQAHADHGLDPDDATRLDSLVAHAYHLDDRQLDHIRQFDLWLGGQS